MEYTIEEWKANGMKRGSKVYCDDVDTYNKSIEATVLGFSFNKGYEVIDVMYPDGRVKWLYPDQIIELV